MEAATAQLLRLGRLERIFKSHLRENLCNSRKRAGPTMLNQTDVIPIHEYVETHREIVNTCGFSAEEFDARLRVERAKFGALCPQKKRVEFPLVKLFVNGSALVQVPPRHLSDANYELKRKEHCGE